jgi:translation initiation factor IF-2
VKKPKTEKTKTEVRTPIVAVMGHVDHGKTTLLDSLRGAKVVDSEAGGITQNTRAHQVVTDKGHKITFIDTPGHEAFSLMRARGAEVTDYVLLVVAADDGLQPQTIESIKFAHETKTPIIVALNKMDLGLKSMDKVKKQLSDHDVLIEEYGGDVMLFPISALKKDGLKELVEGIELLAEINELKSNPLPDEKGVTAVAYTMESTVDKHIGAVALAILQAGKLTGREVAVTKNQIFRVRAYLDEFQKARQTVEESDPFWMTGLKSTIETGQLIYFTNNEKLAKDLQAKLFKAEPVVVAAPEPVVETTKEEDDSAAMDMLALMFSQRDDVQQGTGTKLLPVIVKSSTQGTLEALLAELRKLEDDEVKLQILESGVGDVTEREVERAKMAKGIVLSFQRPLGRKVLELAKRERVIVRNYEVIYEMLDEVSMAMSGLLEPEMVETEIARALVKQVFVLTNKEVVAGCEVTKGTIIRGYDVKVERKGKEIARGKISSLKHFKEEVKEAKKGFECGIVINPPFADLQTGDEIIPFKVERA